MTNDRLKILFIPAWYPTKKDPVNGIFIKEQAKALQVFNDVTVLYRNFTDRKSKGKEIDDYIDEFGVRNIVFDTLYRKSLTIKFFSYCRAIWKYFKVLKKSGYRPDIIHTHAFFSGPIATLLAKKHRIPVILSLHKASIMNKTLSPMKKLGLQISSKWANAIFVVSSALSKGLLHYGVDKSKIHIVPNTINTDKFFPKKTIYSSKDKKIRILSICMLRLSKKLDVLLQAISKINDSGGELLLNIVGDGEGRSYYEKFAQKLGLSDIVNFHGATFGNNLVEFIHECDFFVLASPWETFGIVIIEALACGKPVVITSEGGPRDFVTDKMGVFAKPNNPDDLAKAIEYMMNKYKEYNSDEIYIEIDKQFSYKIIGKKIDAIYRSLIKNTKIGN